MSNLTEVELRTRLLIEAKNHLVSLRSIYGVCDSFKSLLPQLSASEPISSKMFTQFENSQHLLECEIEEQKLLVASLGKELLKAVRL